MKNNSVLITGGLGFIGLEVARHLLERGLAVVLLDNLSAQIHGAIPELAGHSLLRDPRVQVIRGDVSLSCDWETALAGVGAVVHLAAETGTAQSMYQIARYCQTNVGGTAMLLDHLADHRHTVEKIVLASSRAVYGEGAYRCGRCGVVYPPARSPEMLRGAFWQPPCPICQGPIQSAPTPEDAPTSPASIYAATKLAQEGLLRVAARALGIPAVIFRFQNVYGEGQSLKNPYTGMLSIFCNQARLGKTLELYEDGQESRDFVHVSDIARAVCLSLTGDGADGWTLNVGSGQATSVEWLAGLLTQGMGGKVQFFISGQYRLGDIRHGYADLSALRRRLNFVPEISLAEGMTRFLGWVKTQPLEADRLPHAARELAARGLMATPNPDRESLSGAPSHGNAKAASV